MSTENKRTYAAMSTWLFYCCVMVFLIVVVGGATRLTESGLSIVEWKPFTGILPPLSLQDWQELFAKYQQYPEFQLVNHTMNLDEFKSIFWLEYIHRIIARLIGLVFFIPWMYFLIFRRIAMIEHAKLFFLFCLGALQGLMGWYMVKSGLVSEPNVSHYRLAAHLFLAVLIFSCMFWLSLRFAAKGGKFSALSYRSRIFNHKNYFLNGALPLLIVLVFVMIVSGAFVAGTKAGHIYNTFPKMNGVWMPNALFSVEPLWRNFLDNPAMIQFTHRALALFLFCFITVTTIVMLLSKKTLTQKLSMTYVFILALIQVILGIATLLSSVPISLGVIHQGNALLLLTSVLYANYCYRY